MIIRKIRLTEYEYQPPINYVAGATEPDIQFQLADYNIPAGATARCYVQRFDGTFEYTVASIDGNNVTVEPTSSMFSVRGEGAIQITLYAGEEVLKTFSVPVFVHADLADENAEQGSDVTGIFRAAEEQALADFAEDAEAKAEEVIESIPEDYTELTEEVDELNERLTAIEESGVGISEDLKQALLQLAEKVAYIDEDGSDYYQDLYDALYPPAELVSISAVYTQSGTVYNTDSLDDLKSDLVVTAHWDNTPDTTVSGNDYILSGSLITGTSTITVTYGGKTTTFNVIVTEYVDPAIYKWDFKTSMVDTKQNLEATTNATRDSNGLAFDSVGRYCEFTGTYAKDRTYVLDISTFLKTSPDAYGRLWMVDGDTGTSSGGQGYITTGNGKGGDLFYIGTWETSNIIVPSNVDHNGSYYANSTIAFYVDENGYVSVYKDGELLGVSSTAISKTEGTNVYIGSSGTGDYLVNLVVTGCRIYEGAIY